MSYDVLQEGERVAKLLGIDHQGLYQALCKPRIKVGNEFVTQGRNVNQVSYSVGAMSKAMFDRLFKFLVKKCNETLDTKQKRQHFIGVLDIAGFEIFDVSFQFFLESYYQNYFEDKRILHINISILMVTWHWRSIKWFYRFSGINHLSCSYIIPLSTFTSTT